MPGVRHILGGVPEEVHLVIWFSDFSVCFIYIW